MAGVTLQQLHQEAGSKKLPKFRAGQTVRVHQRIEEKGKERIQIFEGLIIETSGGRGVGGSITVRKITDGIGVERVFPIHSPYVKEIELVKEAKVRRSRIFFMRERRGKSARLQERFFSDADLAEMMPEKEEDTSVQTETTADKTPEEVPVAKENVPEEETATADTATPEEAPEEDASKEEETVEK